MSEETPNVKKLTAEDLPELANEDPSPSGEFYCRCYKQTWTGWEQISCSNDFGSEDDCRRHASYTGADSYSWTYKSC
jgi:hypothetical protein